MAAMYGNDYSRAGPRGRQQRRLPWALQQGEGRRNDQTCNLRAKIVHRVGEGALWPFWWDAIGLCPGITLQIIKKRIFENKNEY